MRAHGIENFLVGAMDLESAQVGPLAWAANILSSVGYGVTAKQRMWARTQACPCGPTTCKRPRHFPPLLAPSLDHRIASPALLLTCLVECRFFLSTASPHLRCLRRSRPAQASPQVCAAQLNLHLIIAILLHAASERLCWHSSSWAMALLV